MKIAFDGGAFQQGIAGGIYTVAVGLLNAATELDEDFSYVLVADSRLGPVRDELIAQLNRQPEVIYAEIGPAYDPPLRGVTTTAPRVRFEIDGRVVTPRFDGKSLTYVGPPPEQSFFICSRASRPGETSGGPDMRLLGISIRAIQISDEDGTRFISERDPAIFEGFQVPEHGYRWTNGRGRIPASLLASQHPEVTITVELAGTMIYRLLDGRFDPQFNEIAENIRSINRAMRVAAVEQTLIDMGVSIYVMNHFIPARMRRLRTFSILYDMIPVLQKQFFMPDARANFAHNVIGFGRSEHVFSISDASRDDLLRLEKLPPDQVSNMGIDCAPDYTPQARESTPAVLAARGLALRPYILCVGTLEPRKNHLGMLAGFDLAFRDRGFPFDLVVVGKRGWGYDGFLESVAQREMGRFVHLLEDVSNAELAALYAGAQFSAYASLYEGFGLPVLEAMACGCAVLTSNISSMPEIAGDAALLVNPKDPAEIASGMLALADNASLRATLVDRGYRRRRAYSWKISARRVLDTLMTQREPAAP